MASNNNLVGALISASGSPIFPALSDGDIPCANSSFELVPSGASCDGDLITIPNLLVPGNASIQGTLTTINTEQMNVADANIYLNNGYTSTTQIPGGWVTNNGSTGTSDTVTAGAFTAGVAATSNPNVVTDGSATFSTSMLIQFSASLNNENDGLFEVLSHVGTLLTIRGVGTTSTVESFTQNQFVTNASDTAVITNVNVAVSRMSTAGMSEQDSGSSTGFTFVEIGAAVNELTNPNIVYVTSANASQTLPGLGTGTISLAVNTRYIGDVRSSTIAITDNIVFNTDSRLEYLNIVTSGSIDTINEENITIERCDITYTGAGTLFDISDIGGLTELNNIRIFMTGGGKAFDIVSVTDPNSIIIFNLVSVIFTSGGSVGSIDSVSNLLIEAVNFLNFSIGITFTDIIGATRISVIGTTGINASETHITFDGTTQGTIHIDSFNATIQSNEHAINFNSTTNFPGTVRVLASSPSGVTENFFAPTSFNQTTVGFKFVGNTNIPDSTSNAYINALDQSAVQTLLDQNVIQRITATFTDQGSERFDTNSAGTIESLGNETITSSLLATITGTVSTGTNISCNFYFAKGNSTNAITGFSDAGGGAVTATTSSDHGYSNGDRIIIEDTTNYDAEYTIANVTSTTFDFTATWVSTETGSHYQVQEFTKASNTFSSTATKNTSMVSQISLSQNDQMFLCVENTGNSGEWETDDIQSIYVK